MFYIVESDNQFERLKTLSRLGGYVDIVPNNNLVHPLLSSTVAVYIRPTGSKHGFIIPIDHPDGLSIGKDRVYEILKTFKFLYTLNKKNLLYHFNLPNSIDLNLVYSMTEYDRLDINKENYNTFFYNKFRSYKDINKLVPITKLFETCEEIFNKVEPITKYDIPPGFDFYNKVATAVFFLIEHSGIKINYSAFNELFNPKDPLLSIENNIAYTSYNLYNSTSRPTNAFNSVNFAAIPKTEDHKKCFVPKNDMFVEFDFDGYHLRLLCELLDYNLEEESAHMEIAKKYFNKDIISEDEYSEVKQLNFQALYGKITAKQKKLEVFQKIDKFINNLWDEYNKNGFIINPHSGKHFTPKLGKMNPQKLMNYLMQSIETSRNITILKDVLNYLKNKNTNVVLYTYDAILFDFSKKDGKQTLEDIKKILESNKKYPVKFKYSDRLV
tara:strand:+ start:2642 stop:3961 length:1320 start_codon:yes stop_codon:yes gene_type:complete